MKIVNDERRTTKDENERIANAERFTELAFRIRRSSFVVRH